MDAIQIAIVVVSLLGLAFGTILGCAPHRFAVEDGPAVERIDEILLQSQRGQCGHPGCRPYAGTISCNGEKINYCASGDEAVMLKIAELLNVKPQPLDDEAQEIAPVQIMAVIDENNCTGCTKRTQACPVDTIVDATCTMHMIISDLYTGCNSCVDPCPIHCISLQPVVETPGSRKWDLNTISMHIIPVERHA